MHRASIADNTASTMQLPLWDANTPVAPRLRHSHRARRVSIRVHEDASVELVVPRGVSEARARAFLASRSQWVDEQVRQRRTVARPPEPFPPPQLHLNAIDERWRLHVAGGSGRARLHVVAPGLLELSGHGERAQWAGLLRKFLLTRAQQQFAPMLAALADQYGFSYTQLSVRVLRSRWGSCSARGRITLNLALLFQRPRVARYLLLHELAHTRHMNHSRAFWRCVADCEPQWRELDRELLRGGRLSPRWLALNFAEGAR
ncbi:MAG: M48 family metallopeptidase [Nevskiaceae bacterium]|jgi:predicted metal-dependent hydrolase|nr:M48 family metallopeptidase [Nevskiaceae bacterium]